MVLRVDGALPAAVHHPELRDLQPARDAHAAALDGAHEPALPLPLRVLHRLGHCAHLLQGRRGISTATA